MIRIKLALAAWERYGLEKPIRAMYDDQRTKKHNPPFSIVLDVLSGRGLILKEDAQKIGARYRHLSEILHGRLA